MLRRQPIFSPPKTKHLRVIKRVPIITDLTIPEVSIPGIKNISQPTGNLRKFLWMLAIIFCLCVALVQIKERIDHYVNGGTAVRVSVAQDEKPNVPFITLCPPARLDLNMHINYWLRYYLSRTKQKSCRIFDVLNIPGLNITRLWKFTQLNLTGILITSWNNSVNDSFEKTFFPSLHGYCVTYHALKKFPTHLLPELTIELTETGWWLNEFWPGYKIIIHDDPYLTSYDVGSQGLITYGFSKLVMKTTFTKFSYLNTRKTPCTANSKELNDCRNQCIDQKLRNRINTRLPYHTVPNLPLCSTSNTCITSKVASMKFFSSFDWNQCECPRLCSGFVYSTSKYYGYMGSNKQSFVRIYINLDDTIIDKIDEYTSYTEVSLLCDIGAILGLMLGTCILTFIQLIEVIIYLVQRSVKKNTVVSLVKPFHD